MYRLGLSSKSSSEQVSGPDQVKKVEEEQRKGDVSPEKYMIEKEKPQLDTDAWYASYRKPTQETSQTGDPKTSTPNKNP